MRDVRGIVSKKEVAAIVSRCVFESWNRLGIIIHAWRFFFFIYYYSLKDDLLMIRINDRNDTSGKLLLLNFSICGVRIFFCSILDLKCKNSSCNFLWG